MTRLRWLALALLVLAGGIALLGATAGRLPPSFGRELRYGVHTIPADDRTLSLAREAGFDTVVELFSWRQIEPTEGQFHWQQPDEIVSGAEYYGLDLTARLDQHPAWASPITSTLNAPPDDLADYIRFASTVAERYRGRIKAYVIWNEPNLAREWGGQAPDPAAYTAMLCAAYRAVKAADPQALVVSAGLAPTNHADAEALDDRRYLEAMYAAGARGCFDALGAHPYGFAYPPDDPRGAHDGLNLARIEDLREIMVRHGDRGKPVWATEMGWTVAADGDSAWQTVSLEQQADYLVAALKRARRDWPWLELVAIWNLADHDQPEWSGYSLLDAEGNARPALRALAAMDKGGKLPALGERTEKLASGQGRLRLSVLAPDAVIHLGDSDFSEPWMPLFGNRNPSARWEGVFYVPDPGETAWRLSLRLMQSNTPGNYIWINGQRLEASFPPEDFSGSWVSVNYDVPASLLRPGRNDMAITVGRTLPLLQDERFAWDDLQIKDIVLSSR